MLLQKIIDPPEEIIEISSGPSWNTAESCDQLCLLLKDANPGDTIELLESIEYFGDFYIVTKNLTVAGNGAKIFGKNIGLSIKADECIIQNLHLQGDTGIFISGECKYGLQTSLFVSKLKVVDSCIGKLYLEGNEHVIENSTVLFGAAVVGNQNYFKDVNFGSRLELQGKLHKLYKCSTDQLVKHGSVCDVEIIRCNFD